MYISTIIGLVLGMGAVWLGIVDAGGTFKNYYDIPSLKIVLLATLGFTIMGCGLANALSFPAWFLQALLPPRYNPARPTDLVTACMRMADKARQFGLPSLTSEIPVAVDEFMQRGIKLLVAGTDSKTVEEIMMAEIDQMKERHAKRIEAIDNVIALLPAMGMVGTLIGLIQVLGNLEDVSKLGPSMAIAMITTLYGSLFANGVFLPLGTKLRQKSKDEALMKEMLVKGLLAVQAGEASPLVGSRCKAFFSDKMRARIEGGKGGSKKKTEKHIELTTYMGAADQERALAFIAEMKAEAASKSLGQDDIKTMLADLINNADDKVLGKDFANEVMKLKLVKKLPKGTKRKPKKKKGAAAAKGKAVAAKKKAVIDDDDD